MRFWEPFWEPKETYLQRLAAYCGITFAEPTGIKIASLTRHELDKTTFINCTWIEPPKAKVG